MATWPITLICCILGKVLPALLYHLRFSMDVNLFTKENIFVFYFFIFLSLSRESYTGLRIARIDFDPPLSCDDCDTIVLAFMLLVIQYAYTIKCEYGKLALCYVMRTPTIESDITFTLSPAIPFKEDWKDLPVYALIEQLVRQKAEEYDGAASTTFKAKIRTD